MLLKCFLDVKSNYSYSNANFIGMNMTIQKTSKEGSLLCSH